MDEYSDLVFNIGKKKIVQDMKKYGLGISESMRIFLSSYFFVLISDSKSLGYNNSFKQEQTVIENKKILKIVNFT